MRWRERGMVTVEYMAAAGLGILMFVMITNLVVWQFQRGVIQLAADQGVRAGSVRGGGIADCRQAIAEQVDQWHSSYKNVSYRCFHSAGLIRSVIRANLDGWLVWIPEFSVNISSEAAVEP